MLADLRYRLRALLRRDTVEAELDEELRDHLERETEKLIALGHSRTDATRRARLAFGSLDDAKEQSRDARGVLAFETLVRDTRYALRILAKTPVFTAVAVLSLAIGIGANTAVFSVVNAIWLKPLAIRDPGSLVMVSPDDRIQECDYPLANAFRARTDVFADLAGVGVTQRSNISIGGDPNAVEPRPAGIHMVTGNYFALLGVSAALGRVIGPDDDRLAGGHPVVVISDAYWRRRFAADAAVVGRTLGLNGLIYTVIGVAPATFTGDVLGRPAELWMPVMMQAQIMVERPGLLTNPRPPWLRMLARLAPGVTPERAAAMLTTMYQQTLMDRIPLRQTILTSAEVARERMLILPAGRGYSGARAAIARPVLITWGLVALVLLLASVNVAGLLLARAMTREREIATRLAIGAGRARIARQLLTEGMTLAAISGALGVAAAWFGIRSLENVVHSGADPLSFDVSPDGRVLVVTLVICLLTGLVAGLAPALRANRTSLVPSLIGSRDVGHRGRLARFGLGPSLVVTQVALSLTLVVAAGLLTRTLLNLRDRDVGFDRSRILLAWASPSQAGLVKDRLAPLYGAALTELSGLPGVRSVAVSSRGVLGSSATGSPIRVPGYVARPTDDYFVGWNLVTPNFFVTTGIRIVAGRAFTSGDIAGSQQVAIISQSLASHYFGIENPVGKRFGIRIADDFPLEVVGVARDVVDQSLHESSAVDMIYLPYAQDIAHLSEMCVIVRTEGPPPAFAESVRRTLRQVESSLPVLSVVSMDDHVAAALVQERLITILAGVFGALALGLASIGLYAIIAQSVSARTSELAVRVALGGSPKSVVSLILSESLMVVAAGIVAGIAITMAAVRAIAHQLFGVSAFDPATVIGAIVIMTGATGLAAMIPALRAARTDPIAALRAG